MIKKLLIAVLACVFALIVMEIGLRIFSDHLVRYSVWPPNFKVVLQPSPEIMPGIEGESLLQTSSMGIRGDEFSPKDQQRVLTVGGSTTECFFLDQKETWPYLLQQKLETQTHQSVWIGNIGKSGALAEDNRLHLKYLLDQYPHIDTVIILPGVNDFMHFLRNGPDAVENTEADVIKRAFFLYPDPDHWLLRVSAIGRMVSQIKHVYFTPVSGPLQDKQGRYHIRFRNRRQEARMIEEVPDLKLPLEVYAKQIQGMIQEGRSRSIRIVFLTQPFAWRKEMPLEQQKLLWFGRGKEGSDPHVQTYYSVEVLRQGMGKYNQTLQEVCRAQKIECIDAARLLPRDTSVFYDDVHFNENGARLLSQLLCEHLLQKNPSLD